MNKKPDYLEARKESNRTAQNIINQKACKHHPQDMILAHFQRGKSLTVLTALQYYHTTELRKVVSRLRRMGYKIYSESVTEKDGTRHNKYWMYGR